MGTKREILKAFGLENMTENHLEIKSGLVLDDLMGSQSVWKKACH